MRHRSERMRERVGTLLSPAHRRRCIDHVMTKLDVSERLARRVLGQHRSTQRKTPKGRADEAALTAEIVALATQYEPLWLPPDHGDAAGGGLGRERQAG